MHNNVEWIMRICYIFTYKALIERGTTQDTQSTYYSDGLLHHNIIQTLTIIYVTLDISIMLH